MFSTWNIGLVFLKYKTKTRTKTKTDKCWLRKKRWKSTTFGKGFFLSFFVCFCLCLLSVCLCGILFVCFPSRYISGLFFFRFRIVLPAHLSVYFCFCFRQHHYTKIQRQRHIDTKKNTQLRLRPFRCPCPPLSALFPHLCLIPLLVFGILWLVTWSQKKVQLTTKSVLACCTCVLLLLLVPVSVFVISSLVFVCHCRVFVLLFAFVLAFVFRPCRGLSLFVLCL